MELTSAQQILIIRLYYLTRKRDEITKEINSIKNSLIGEGRPFMSYTELDIQIMKVDDTTITKFLKTGNYHGSAEKDKLI